MSKDSSIKVFAENVGDTNPRPVNNIPVWIENVSAIGGGGEPVNMSAKLDASAVGFYKDYYGTYYVSGISGKQLSAERAWRAEFCGNADIANTANYAYTAEQAAYDGNGNNLLQTHNELVSLNEFIQNNSANWGGSGPTGSNEKVLFHKSYSYDPYGANHDVNYVSGASDLYFNCAVNNNEQPQEIIIRNNGTEYGIYWNSVSSEGSITYYSGSINGLPTNVELELNSNGSYVFCYVSANGNKINFPYYTDVTSQPSTNVKFNVHGYNITGRIDGGNPGSITPLTSFTGDLTDFSTNGFDRYNWSIFEESYGNNWYYDISAEFGGAGGSTVTSGDVLPPAPTGTGNTYALYWNDANGLFWDIR